MEDVDARGEMPMLVNGKRRCRARSGGVRTDERTLLVVGTFTLVFVAVEVLLAVFAALNVRGTVDAFLLVFFEVGRRVYSTAYTA